MDDKLISTPQLPDNYELLKQSWEIFKKHILFFSLISLPLILIFKYLFDVCLMFYLTHRLNSNFDIFFSICFLIYYKFATNVIMLYLDNTSNNLAHLFLTALKKLPKTFSGPIFGYSPFSDLIFLLENVRLNLSQIKSKELIRGYEKVISERINFINIIFRLSVFTILPLIPIKILQYNNALILIFSILFIIGALFGFIFRNIFIFKLYSYIKELPPNPDASLNSSLPISDGEIANEALDSFIIRLYKGRLDRRGFWFGNGILILIFCVSILLSYIIFIYTSHKDSLIALLGVIFLIITIFTFIIWYIYSISFTIRRLHDLNKNGWFMLLFLIPIYGLFILLYIIFKQGTNDKNKFGDRATKYTFKKIFCFP